MSGLWAVARMTLLEASRRRIFYILLLFAAALVSSAAFFPSVDAAGRLRLIEIWSLRATTIFTAIASLFLAAFSIPGDTEQKRVYLLVSKPLSKPALFLGRCLGFGLLLAIFVAVMGLLTMAYIRVVQGLSRGDFPALVATPRVETGEFGHIGGEEGADPGRLIIRPPGNNTLVWTFRGLRRSDFPERARFEARFHLAAADTKQDPYRASGNVRFIVLNDAQKRFHDRAAFLNTSEETEIEFPSALIGDDGVLQIQVQRLDEDGLISATSRSVLLMSGSANFEVNFVRGMALVYFQSLLVLSVTLMGSTFLSAPVSILLGIVIYLVGSMHGFVLEGAQDINRALDESRLSKAKAKTPEDLPPWLLRASTAISGVALRAIPDFSTFDFAKWLLRDVAVSGREIRGAGLAILPQVVVLTGLGVLVMAFKDFG